MGKNDLKRDKRFKRHLAQQLQVEQPPKSYLQAVQDAFDSLPDELPVKARPLRTFGRARGRTILSLVTMLAAVLLLTDIRMQYVSLREDLYLSAFSPWDYSLSLIHI